MYTSSSIPIRRAVRYALLTGAVGSAATPVAAPAADDPIAEVVVTGSRIRRVDAETANPVFVYDTEAIQRSGVTTLGDLIQKIPSISGSATNPQVNNGGGNGDSNVELRGLSPERTLVLLNGRRIGPIGYSTGAVDVNMIPVNLIDRVEVLKEGAGAIYGSDAIAGVVNFITRKPADGSEVGYEYGVSGEGDGKRHSISLSLGATSDKGGVLVGANYNKQEAVSAGDRDFSRFALYLYNAAVYGVFVGGSSRAPNGRIDVPAATFNSLYGCEANSAGNVSLTRIAGAPGAALNDYRCFVTSGANADFYNYQPLNLLLTPQERGSLFTIADYEINDYAEVYTELLYNRTSSGFELAPLPFDSRDDDVVISANSIYNPFSVDLGGIDAVNPNAQWRLASLGNRRNDVSTDAAQVNLGARGEILSSGWQWDATISYGRMEQHRHYEGFLFKSKVQDALGPSFLATDGTPTCGTVAEPIPNCAPVNIFNLTAEGQSEALGTIASAYNDSYTYQNKGVALTVNGDVFDLPSGPLQAAAGYENRDLSGVFNTDYLTEAIAPLYATCLLASETCSASSRGSYDVSEFYAEFLVPLLADLPAVASLNLTVGARYSDYSTFGDTTNTVFKVEYRPIDDVLVRSSLAEVFRAPTIYNLFHGPSKDAPTFNDPCTGIDAGDVAANPNLALACQNVPLTGNFEQPNSQVSGLWLSNSALNAETGDVLTYGLVYEPSAVAGLSISLDWWRYQIEGLITRIDPNYAADQCVASGSPQFCDLIVRNGDGTIRLIREPYVNLGELKTSGVDLGARYTLRGTGIGDFRFSLESTYIDSYESRPSPGSPSLEVAGTYDRQFGNYARWRALVGVAWAFNDLDAVLSTRYVHSLTLKDPDGFPGIQPNLDIGSITYTDLTVGYEFPTDTRVQLGVLNLQDKQPPLLYQNNVTNANTDVSTYDTVGRQFFATVSQKF